MLERLTAEMDARIRSIAPGRDSVDLGPESMTSAVPMSSTRRSVCPLLVVVLEEYPGLLRVLDGTDKGLGRAARAAVARLLAEGGKAGVRVVLVAQRAEANIVEASGTASASCSGTASMRSSG